MSIIALNHPMKTKPLKFSNKRNKYTVTNTQNYWFSQESSLLKNTFHSQNHTFSKDKLFSHKDRHIVDPSYIRSRDLTDSSWRQDQIGVV